MQSYDDDAEEEEEDVDVVKVFYDDDPTALQPILASLATPADPFARGIATQAGWNQQIKAVFQDNDAGDDSSSESMKVVGPVDVEEEGQLPINTLTNVCLIGEGLARLNLSDDEPDGVVCGVLTKATDALREAVLSAQTEFVKITSDQKNIAKAERREREEKASGFFLPIWTLMDQMKHVDMDAGDLLALARRHATREAQEAQRGFDTDVLSLLNLASSNLGFHLVDRSVRRSAAFGRMNPWLHAELLRLFDRYRVVGGGGDSMPMMKRIAHKASPTIKNVISIQRVRVTVSKNIISFNEGYLIAHPKTNSNDVVSMDGIEITLKQHDNAKLMPSEKPFKTGTHAAIHFRPQAQTVVNNDEAADTRGNTLSFLYRWPEIEQEGYNIETVKIVLYGSGKGNWWEDYYRLTKDDNNVMPYPPRRVYIAKDHTMIEYHDIMYLIFAQSLYGNFGDLPNSIKLVQSVFATRVSGAIAKTFVMVVLESREDVAHPYPRLSGKSEPIPKEKIDSAWSVIRKFPRMRDLFFKKSLTTTWEVLTSGGKPVRGRRRIRGRRTRKEAEYAALTEHIVPLTDLLVKRTDSSPVIPDQIRLKPYDRADIESIGGMTWINAAASGLQNLSDNFMNIPEQRSQELADFVTSLDFDDETALDLAQALGDITLYTDPPTLKEMTSLTTNIISFPSINPTKPELAQLGKEVLINSQRNIKTREASKKFVDAATDKDDHISITILNDAALNAELKKNEESEKNQGSEKNEELKRDKDTLDELMLALDKDSALVPDDSNAMFYPSDDEN